MFDTVQRYAGIIAGDQMPSLGLKNSGSKKALSFGFLKNPRIIRRFKENDEGVTAIEFGMLAFPFFMLLMAIVETSIFFFAGQVMESAVDDVGRMVRTGQLDGATAGELRTEICNRSSALFNCNDILIDMKVVARFEDLGDAPGPSGGKLDPASFSFEPAGPREIVMLTVAAEWPIYTNYLQRFMSNLDSKNALLTAISVFQTEPFS